MPSVSPELVERVKADKARRQTASRYCDRQTLAFIVHSFNRLCNIDQLHAGLRRLGDHELIVCDDGSLDGSHEKWMSYLTRPNDFLIHCNDLHEIRALDRAIRFCQADFVCLVQDDDIVPDDIGWLDDVLRWFDVHPRLAIIGGFMGFSSFHPDPDIAKPLWGSQPFRFVHHVNIGPYFIRKCCYETLEGWDFSFSQAGEPGICFDSEFCLRAWLKGYQVGYSFVPFKGPPGHYALDGGTMLFSEVVRRRNQQRNQESIYAKYERYARHITRLVGDANERVGVSLT